MINKSNGKQLTKVTFKWLLKATLKYHTEESTRYAMTCHHSVATQGGNWIVATDGIVLHAAANTIDLPVGVYAPFDDGYLPPLVSCRTPYLDNAVNTAFAENIHELSESAQRESTQGEDRTVLNFGSFEIDVLTYLWLPMLKLSKHYTVTAFDERHAVLVKHFGRDGSIIAWALIMPAQPLKPVTPKSKRKVKA